jgi:hypothetical protein
LAHPLASGLGTLSGLEVAPSGHVGLIEIMANATRGLRIFKYVAICNFWGDEFMWLCGANMNFIDGLQFFRCRCECG